jgi:hypothetical protein
LDRTSQSREKASIAEDFSPQRTLSAKRSEYFFVNVSLRALCALSGEISEAIFTVNYNSAGISGQKEHSENPQFEIRNSK